jgi:glyoxylase-like metal-dependent hydrolase (beta-lactamase superfamily II)
VVHIIDTHQLGRAGIVAATALETDDGLALFDTGPESTFDNVVAGLSQAGFGAEDVRHIFLSHIHFDHAGAAWRFGASRTGGKGATVYVHPRGAPHLIDPAKLIASATRIFGDDMQRLWGKIEKIPADRVKIVQDNDVVRLGQFEIRAIETPGHASHHHVYQWDDNVFGGDIAGVCIGAGPPIPPFVPPELHIESWLESIHKIRALNCKRLYLPHFGKIDHSIPDHLDALEERVTRWSEWFKEKLRAFRNPHSEIRNLESELIPLFAEYEHADIIAGSSALATDPSSLVTSYETADPSYMAVAAAIRYWNKYHPDQLL